MELRIGDLQNIYSKTGDDERAQEDVSEWFRCKEYSGSAHRFKLEGQNSLIRGSWVYGQRWRLVFPFFLRRESVYDRLSKTSNIPGKSERRQCLT